MRHFTIKKYLSVYIDDELNESNRLEIKAHLKECSACRKKVKSIQKGKVLASHFEPQLWEGSESTWIQIRNRLFENPPHQLRPGFFQRIKAAADQGQALLSPKRSVLVFAGLTILILVSLLVRPRFDPSYDPASQINIISANAFDYGLYLSALSEDREPSAFETMYGSRPVSYEAVRKTMPFNLVSFSDLPDDYQLTEVQLLKNGCCSSVQCIIQMDSRSVIVFQQPREHPFTFGSYTLERTDIEGHWYHKVEAGSYQALSWVEGSSRLVAMGDMSKEDMHMIMQKIKQ